MFWGRCCDNQPNVIKPSDNWTKVWVASPWVVFEVGTGWWWGLFTQLSYKCSHESF